MTPCATLSAHAGYGVGFPVDRKDDNAVALAPLNVEVVQALLDRFDFLVCVAWGGDKDFDYVGREHRAVRLLAA
jgi:hypothetical protein